MLERFIELFTLHVVSSFLARIGHTSVSTSPIAGLLAFSIDRISPFVAQPNAHRIRPKIFDLWFNLGFNSTFATL